MRSATTRHHCDDSENRTLTWRHFVSKTALFTAITAVALAVPAAAQTKTKATEQPSPDHVRALIAQAMDQLNAPAQTPGQARPATSGPSMDLTVDEAVARALERNVTLASQRLTPQTFDYQLAATRAFYRPTVTSVTSSQSSVQLGRLTTDGGLKTEQQLAQWNGGITQQVKRYGGNYSVQWTNNRTGTNQNTAQFNPAYETGLQMQYTQPLLSNLRIDNTRTNLQTQAIQQDQAELDLKATVASTVAQVRNAYWELVYAVMNLENQRASLALATKLVQDNQARVEIGTLAPIDVVQAQAEEATRRQNVVTAEATLQNNELALKRLIVSGTEDPLWTATLNAVDRPTATTEAIDLQGAVTNALGNRTDLLRAKKDIDSANVTLRSLSNQSMPTLNLQGTYLLRGRGGRPNDPTLPITSWWNALGGVGTIDAPTWTVQMNFSYPLGQSQAEANKARQQILIQQSQTTVKATELQIATEVTAASIAIRSSLEAIQAAAAASQLSQRRLEAAQSKLEVGMATNFEVVQAQRDLADARNRELREQLNYRRALVDFQRVQVSPR
jgi:outer membrane protein